MRRVDKPDFAVLLKISWSLIWRSALWYLPFMAVIFTVAIYILIPLVFSEYYPPAVANMGPAIFILLIVTGVWGFFWSFARALRQVLGQKFDHPQLALVRQTDNTVPERDIPADIDVNPDQKTLYKICLITAMCVWLGMWIIQVVLTITILPIMLLMAYLFDDANLDFHFGGFEGIIGFLMLILSFTLVLRWLVGKSFDGFRVEVIAGLPESLGARENSR